MSVTMLMMMIIQYSLRCNRVTLEGSGRVYEENEAVFIKQKQDMLNNSFSYSFSFSLGMAERSL